MLRIADAARDVGLLPESITFVDPRDAGHLPRQHVLYLCTGSQGEPRAALARIARDDHRDLTLSDGDTVIFSSKIIPGNEREIFNLLNDLVDLGVEVITEKDADIHVSGHPCQDELKAMYGWARPSIAIPVHGEARHLEAHADFAEELGVDESLAPRNGDLIRIAPEGPSIIEEVPAGRLFLDGSILTPDGASPIRERRKLSYGGVAAVSLIIDKKQDLAGDVAVVLYGAPFDTDYDDERPSGDTQQLAEEIDEAFYDLHPNKRHDNEAVEIVVKRAVRRYCDDVWGKRPIILTQIHRQNPRG